ncbi:MAG: hypothetical protein KGJ55_09190 [Gammaproteobacteria bacterium]|nr:hypothetical protein [Gammaproteobacteria bacterium]
MSGPPVDEAGEARGITQGAARRALGERPLLRRISLILWPAFLGAAATMLALLLVPENFVLPPQTPGGTAIVFMALWLLALIPAWIAAVLASPARADVD